WSSDVRSSDPALGQAEPTNRLLAEPDLARADDRLVVDQRQSREDLARPAPDPQLAQRLVLLGRIAVSAPQQERRVLGVRVDRDAADLQHGPWLPDGVRPSRTSVGSGAYASGAPGSIGISTEPIPAKYAPRLAAQGRERAEDRSVGWPDRNVSGKAVRDQPPSTGWPNRDPCATWHPMTRDSSQARPRGSLPTALFC